MLNLSFPRLHSLAEDLTDGKNIAEQRDIVNALAPLVTENFEAPIDPEKQAIFDILQNFLATKKNSAILLSNDIHYFFSNNTVDAISKEFQISRAKKLFTSATDYLNRIEYFSSQPISLAVASDCKLLSTVQAITQDDNLAVVLSHYIVYPPGSMLRMHIDKPRYEYSLIALIMHSGTKYSQLRIIGRDNSSINALDGVGSAVFFKSDALLHARTPLCANESVGILTIGFNSGGLPSLNSSLSEPD